MEEKYSGMAQVMVALPMGANVNQFREQMTRFAKQVMTAFGPQRVKA